MKESAVLDITSVVHNKDRYVVKAPSNTEILQAELADARLLHKLSIELIQEDGTAGLYEKIVEAAVAIMGSQFGTMQMLYPDKGTVGKLRILASCGFTPEAKEYWEWIYSYTGSSCGQVLRTGKREVIPDYRTCEFMQNQPTLQVFLEGGIYAAQSTPLYSRNGKLLGMISTHWKYPYTPPQRHLDLMDILARQAADLIERTQHDEALRESEQRLRALATATDDVIYRMSADWKIMDLLDGRNFLDNTGDSDADWLHKYIVPEDQQLVQTTIDEAIASQSVFQLEHRVVKIDGTVGWVFSRAVPITDHEGNIVEWFGAASDITEKKTLLLQLENIVDERTKELQRSNEDLQQFAHVASHDLKEPVRKIRTFGLRLKNECSDTLSEAGKVYTDKILESASRMSTMIDGVLAYSSVDGIEQKTEVVDLNEILSDIWNDLEILVEQKKAVIKFENLPSVEGVKVLIYQLFYNLINNSLKFSKESEKPVISIKADAVIVDRITYVKINVADNGIGFSSEYNERIFNTFTRLHPKSRFDGTGLGLALSKKIVERHKGTIEASGVEHVGAVITIHLPVLH